VVKEDKQELSAENQDVKENEREQKTQETPTELSGHL
jgi:hypothetical protein